MQLLSSQDLVGMQVILWHSDVSDCTEAVGDPFFTGLLLLGVSSVGVVSEQFG